MTSIQPELWVETPSEAVAFYKAAFGAAVLHRVGDGDDIVAQLGVGDAAFWVAPTSAVMKRLSPRAIDGATSRTLLVVEDPDSVVRQAVAAGATESSPVSNEHGKECHEEGPPPVTRSGLSLGAIAEGGPL